MGYIFINKNMKFALLALLGTASAVSLSKAPPGTGVGVWRVHEYPPGPMDDAPKDPHARKAIADMYDQMKWRNQPSVMHHVDLQIGSKMGDICGDGCTREPPFHYPYHADVNEAIKYADDQKYRYQAEASATRHGGRTEDPNRLAA